MDDKYKSRCKVPIANRRWMSIIFHYDCTCKGCHKSLKSGTPQCFKSGEGSYCLDCSEIRGYRYQWESPEFQKKVYGEHIDIPQRKQRIPRKKGQLTLN